MEGLRLASNGRHTPTSNSNLDSDNQHQDIMNNSEHHLDNQHHLDNINGSEGGRCPQVGGGAEGSPSHQQHVCNSLFGKCAGPVALADIMGNGPPAPIVTELRRQLRNKDLQIANLTSQISKLRSVLQHQQSGIQTGVEALDSLIAGPQKKQGVSGESSDQTLQSFQRYEKDFRSKQLIKAALLENDFLKNLEPGQVREIVDCMYPRQCAIGSFLIKEGEQGSHLYVSSAGCFEVIKDDTVLGTMGPGKAFGELAILYNCTRTASVRVVEDGEVWVLDRKVFQSIMLTSGLQRLEDCLSFLNSVPLLFNVNKTLLTRIADSLQLEFYPGGHYIIRQGTSGDTFYLISQGKVKVTQRIVGTSEEEEVRTLARGDYFGEQALLKEEARTANVIAMAPGVECLTLDRESFMLLIGDLSELQEKDYGDKKRVSRHSSSGSVNEYESDFEKIDLKELSVVATLGVGGFGRVELVCNKKGEVYALKCMKKSHIVETHQQTHVFSERDIMFATRSPFVIRLYQTYRDSKYVYLLMEACLGGEVWSLLRDRAFFDDSTACFYTSCVIEAIEYLHLRNIVYRDLKPENLLLDSIGYVKVVDFGFAKRLSSTSGKTWTFCGTPEYVAPEVILNKGHDKAVDYWAIGILIYELLTGLPPFTSNDPMKTYNLILKGIESVPFPRQVTRTAQNLIKKLCRDVPGERLGCHHVSEIKKHKWFQGFDWEGLRSRTMVPPIIPKIIGPTDTSNFDKFPKEEKIPPDELSNWDANF